MSGGMAMPGGWTMSMAWMRMQGESWLTAAPSCLGMWDVMMAATMLPALVPALLRYRLSLRGPETIHLNALTMLAGAGYFFVWALLGRLCIRSVLSWRRPGWHRRFSPGPCPSRPAWSCYSRDVSSLRRGRRASFVAAVPARGQDLDQNARSAWGHGTRLGARSLFLEADGLYRALHAKDSSWDGHVRFAVLTWEFPVLAKYKFPAIAPRNGRTQREFIRELALQAGFAIDGSRVTRDQMMAASSESFTTGDSSRLAALIGLRIEQSGGLHV